MYAKSVLSRSISVVLFAHVLAGPPAVAQEPAPAGGHEQHQQPATPGHEAHQVPVGEQDHSQHTASGMTLFPARGGSGTAWLPDTTPMYGLHRRAGSWELMAHGNAFAQFLHDGGDRGATQGGSINWAMGMARRPVAGGRFGVRGMLSLEPWTIPGCGYPDLLATGEVCGGEPIHDRQHPHDLFMELAAEYEHAFGASLRWHLYGGPAGEPALGPVAYPHRLSAMPNPLAPIAHHWLDASHITFGVVTTGISGQRWKAEVSAFNGREPDEERTDFDFGALDSLSARLWFLPHAGVALQVSAGHLSEAEAGHEGEPRVDVNRLTASATYHRAVGAESIWASTVAWGRNVEADNATHALLAETNVTLRERHTLFGRFELAGKPAHDLAVEGSDEMFTVAKLQAGYTRYLDRWRGLKPGIGGSLSAGVVPVALAPYYGTRVSLGIGVFVTLRPGAHPNE